MNLPRKISPCPIEEAIIEIRFNSTLPSDAIFGIIYNELKTTFPQSKNLPILQLPENIRLQDPELTYKPYYQLHGDKYLLQIGPRVISLTSQRDYVGWQEFSQDMKTYLQKINKLGIIDVVTRLGLRYINFFELNIFKEITLKINKSNEQWTNNAMVFKTSLPTLDFKSRLVITNEALVGKEQTKRGSVIDIDTSKNGNTDIETIQNELLDSAHIAEKKLFFDLLTPKFLKKLNPEYNK